MRTIAVLTPIYNDWASFAQLVPALDCLLAREREMGDMRVTVLAVNDGSNDMPDDLAAAFQDLRVIERVELLNLVCNVGHQRAIAVGLVEVAQRGDVDGVIVMDADGEDRPEHVLDLLAAAQRHLGHVIVAHRAKRAEGWRFRAAYWIYKLAFRLLTGQTIDFGNFCFIPTALLEWLIHVPEIWNNLASTIVHSRVPLVRVPTLRGMRYAGRSRMNTVSLVIHGLSAVSVYSDVAFVRVLMASLGLSVLTVLGIIVVVAIRFTTDLAIPGWASNVAASLVIMLFQALMFSAGAAFLVLANRSSPSIVPVLEAPRFRRGRVVVFER